MASFDDIKVGDQVVIDPPNSPMSNNPRYVAKVERVTRTQFIVGGYRFRKSSGWQVGGDTWNFATAHCPTPELLAAVSAENRYVNARQQLSKLRIQLETLTHKINRTRDRYQLAETMEAAAADVAAAVAKLRAMTFDAPDLPEES